MIARRRISVDLVITLVLLAFFLGVVFQARQWPFRAALFPMGTALAMLAFIALKLALDARRAGRAEPRPAEGEEMLVEEEAATDAELEDVFASSPRAAWLNAIGWMAVFFVMLWMLGLLITVPVFALLYLLLASRESVLTAVVYAALSWLFMWGLFDRLLHIALPRGLLPPLLGL